MARKWEKIILKILDFFGHFLGIFRAGPARARYRTSLSGGWRGSEGPKNPAQAGQKKGQVC